MTSKEHAAPQQTEANWSVRIRKRLSRVRDLINEDIWELEHLGCKTARARCYFLLRVLTLTFQGLRRNKLPVQSAALTFYSLIGIGPLIALGIMVSSFMIDQSPANLTNGESPAENRAVEWIENAISYAAPQLSIDTNDDNIDNAELAPEITEMINSFIAAAQSGTVGVVGSLMLFVIGIQVLSSIEASFNSLWGVDQGRKLGERIVVYWTFISLGAVMGAAALTLVTVTKIAQLMEYLPFGGEFLSLALILSPIIAFILITTLLAVFFRFIPNTQVNWKAAFTGASLVVVLLQLYNMFSFLYVQRVVDTRSLYGSVGIIVVLMLGLYVFWLLILFGGQITYAVQNADYLTNENAWQKTSEHTQEIISLAVLILVGKRFLTGASPSRASELHKQLRVPSHILNSSINRLCELGYLNAVAIKSIEDVRDHAYQPGHPLESITLGKFKQTFQSYGNNHGAELVVQHTPELHTYLEEIISLKDCRTATLTIRDLISR
ncbi:MAG: YihY/virulence factor BrkB family protein [Opitutae bacterium]|nr:YihY/virulence factor BrkB family protein [Opitutae bacterium]MDG1300836.1 YihY/virulence factor BrkB family protein [Opitutae bacterium]